METGIKYTCTVTMCHDWAPRLQLRNRTCLANAAGSQSPLLFVNHHITAALLVRFLRHPPPPPPPLRGIFQSLPRDVFLAVMVSLSLFGLRSLALSMCFGQLGAARPCPLCFFLLRLFACRVPRDPPKGRVRRNGFPVFGSSTAFHSSLGSSPY